MSQLDLGAIEDPLRWVLSSSSDRTALDLVDGGGGWKGSGSHYSRRTPGSATFTGIGQEVVLVTADASAVWACVRQRTPSKRGSGTSRGRAGASDDAPRYIWRNNVFRKLGRGLASEMIVAALDATYRTWVERYGELPPERLRTEIDISRIRSANPGYCYKMAGWVPDRVVRGKLYLWAPERSGG